MSRESKWALYGAGAGGSPENESDKAFAVVKPIGERTHLDPQAFRPQERNGMYPVILQDATIIWYYNLLQ